MRGSRSYQDWYADRQEAARKYRASTYFPTGEPKRPLFAVKISEDHGNRWKLRALCQECIDTIEPPVRVRKCGDTGARGCDWCGVRNEA